MARWWIINTQQRIPSYVVRAALTSLIPAAFVGVALSVTGSFRPGDAPEFTGSAVPVLFLLVVASPVVETLAMAVVLWVIGLATTNLWIRAGVSAILWAGLHSAVAPLWGPVVLWPFFILSCCYLAWRERSRKHALGVTCCVHMAHNLLPGACMALLLE
jgi:hypothetical protein